MRVLIVEDEENVSAFIAGILRKNDPLVEIEVAANGDHGLTRYMQGGSYDLVITDRGHPGLKGAELIEAIRAKNGAQAIILQTGSVSQLREGFQDKYRNIPVLEKPYRAEQLMALVKGGG